jgi:hypothetical protein
MTGTAVDRSSGPNVEVVNTEHERRDYPIVTLQTRVTSGWSLEKIAAPSGRTHDHRQSEP